MGEGTMTSRVLAALLLLHASHAASASFYDILGCPIDASSATIRAAYKAKALKFHPDKHHGSTKHFESINEAYSCLSDPQQRRAYDVTLLGNNARSRHHFEPRKVHRVFAKVNCTLKQLGGWEPALLDAGALAFGRRHGAGPMLRHYLPPGSQDGDRITLMLGQGVELVMILREVSDVESDWNIIARSQMVPPRLKPVLRRLYSLRRRHCYARAVYSGDEDLIITRMLPAWHNALARMYLRLPLAAGAMHRTRRHWMQRWLESSLAVDVHTVCGERVEAVAAGAPLAPGGERRVLHGYGMPIWAGRGGAVPRAPDLRPWTVARGDLIVQLRLRSMRESLLRLCGIAAAGIGCGVGVVAALGPGGWLRRHRVAQPKTIRLWTGQPRSGAPFRRWGSSTYYEYS